MPRKGKRTKFFTRVKQSQKNVGNLNAFSSGKRSKRMKRPDVGIHCKGCALFSKCPERIEVGDSICPLSEFVQVVEDLGQGDELLEFPALVNYLRSLLKAHSHRIADAMRLEKEEGVGLDGNITSLYRELVKNAERLGKLLGYEKPDPKVLIDNRRQSLNIAVQNLTPEQYRNRLLVLKHARDLDPELAEYLLEGGTIDIDEAEIEEIAGTTE